MSYAAFASTLPALRAPACGAADADVRTVDRAADALNLRVLSSVALDAPLRATWSAWYPQWKAIVAQHYSAGVGADVVDHESTELAHFLDAVDAAEPATGAAPASTAMGAGASVPEGTFRPPWWFWVLATLGIGAAGWYGYSRFKETQLRRLIEVRFGSPQTSGVDPTRALLAGADPETIHKIYAFAPDVPRPGVRRLARSPRPIRVVPWYNPYDDGYGDDPGGVRLLDEDEDD